MSFLHFKNFLILANTHHIFLSAQYIILLTNFHILLKNFHTFINNFFVALPNHLKTFHIPLLTVDITDHIDKKLEAMKCYESQVVDFPGPRSIQAVEALSKLRGTQAGFGFGEGMHIIRMVC